MLESYVLQGAAEIAKLNINKNNILLKVTDTNFSTSRYTMVLNFIFYTTSLFAYNVF